MKRTAALALALTAPLLLAVPAHADEPPTPPTPEAACEARLAAALADATYWRSQSDTFEELYEAARDGNELMTGVAVQWQTRAVAQTQTIARQADRIDRLRAKVAELRKKLREDR